MRYILAPPTIIRTCMWHQCRSYRCTDNMCTFLFHPYIRGLSEKFQAWVCCTVCELWVKGGISSCITMINNIFEEYDYNLQSTLSPGTGTIDTPGIQTSQENKTKKQVCPSELNRCIHSLIADDTCKTAAVTPGNWFEYIFLTFQRRNRAEDGSSTRPLQREGSRWCRLDSQAIWNSRSHQRILMRPCVRL